MDDYAQRNASNIPYYRCHEVSDACPVEMTTLGYFPNKGINIFFAAMFGLAGITTLTLGIWKRTWSYMSFITAGCFLECAGYSARIFLVSNPWDNQAFETQICAIILAPTLICISIYLTLKHVCLSMNPGLSRFNPGLYPFIFVPADVSCLLVQAIGGALAASAGLTNYTLLQGGNRAIIAGIVLQVVVLSMFGAASLDYFFRVKKWIRTNEAGAEAKELWGDKKFRLFVYAVAGAYSGILIRCIYRIAEMAGGWGNYIMQDEPSFIVLEGFMILIPVVLLTAFPPGILFPPMAERMSSTIVQKWRNRKAAKSAKKNGGGHSDGNGTGAEEMNEVNKETAVVAPAPAAEQ